MYTLWSVGAMLKPIVKHVFFLTVLLFIITSRSLFPFFSFFLWRGTDAQSITTNKHADLAFRANLNWLIHIAFARQDYKYCKEVIEYQFRETFDHEYLYYIKVNTADLIFFFLLFFCIAQLKSNVTHKSVCSLCFITFFIVFQTYRKKPIVWLLFPFHMYFDFWNSPRVAISCSL